LYPYTAPGANLTGGTVKEFGQNPSITLSWQAIRHTYAITSIIVDGNSITPTGNTQSGTQGASSVQDIDTTFLMQVSDGTTTTNDTTQVTWEHRRYWGTHSTFSNPSDSDILALTGAGVGTGNELSTNYVKNYNGINGAGNYLVFCWPTSFGTTPTFTVNGLPNTAFTRIRAAGNFTNQYGFVEPYDVWISNTQQNSPITLFSIS